MSWWEWVLIWILLALGALVVLFVVLRGLWRKLVLLFRDLNTATERLAAVTQELERLNERTVSAPEPAAVFDDPGVLRARRFAARTKQGASRRRTRT